MQQKYVFFAKRFTEISQEVLEIPDSSPRGAAVEFQTATAFWKLSAIETQLGNFCGSFTTGSCRSSKKAEAANFCDILEKNHWVVVGL